MKFISLILVVFIFSAMTSNADEGDSTDANLHFFTTKKDFLLNGWYDKKPYQYNQLTSGGVTLTGFDVELVKELAQNLNIDIGYDNVDLTMHQDDLKSGRRDMAAGFTYSKERAKYLYFSTPYRFNEISLFMLGKIHYNFNFENINEFLAQVRLQNFQLAITEGSVYSNQQLNSFIYDKNNQDIIKEYPNTTKSFQALARKEVDGVITDRLTGIASISHNKTGSFVRELKLGIKQPIHLVFSKQTVPFEVVNQFNKEIKKLIHTDEYKKIIKTYLYPVIMLETMRSQWFYTISILAVIAFSITAVAIAAQSHITLFYTLFLAILSSSGCIIISDIVLNDNSQKLYFTASCLGYIVMTVSIGFIVIRFLEYYNKDGHEDDLIKKLWYHSIVLSDTIGQSFFIVIGVLIAATMKLEPLILWGTCFAFMGAHLGRIARDLIHTNHVIINGSMNEEVSVFLGAIFSIYLDINACNLSATDIRNAAMVIIVGAFLTRILLYYFNVTNIYFTSGERKLRKK
ncbi:MAG: substrate-binding periplasmic protein [Rickettsiaceae bacterium]